MVPDSRSDCRGGAEGDDILGRDRAANMGEERFTEVMICIRRGALISRGYVIWKTNECVVSDVVSCSVPYDPGPLASMLYLCKVAETREY